METDAIEHKLVWEQEFDALCLNVDKGDHVDESSSKKYPAKLHARKVAVELGVKDGFIYLPGEPTRMYEDSDQSPPFKQRRYFYYITGANFPDCAVTYEIGEDRLILWIPYVEPRQILWYGAGPDAAEAMRLFDVDDVRYTTHLDKFLQSTLTPSKALYILHPEQAPKVQAAKTLVSVDHNKLRPAMDQARVIKTPYEVDMIRKANHVSSIAHRRVAENMLGMRNEQEIEALIVAVCTSRGAHSQAYPIIAGAGFNASTLHYGANNQPLEGKQLVVVDAGCEWGCYASDITRTLPISGAYTTEAAAIYDIVEEMQDASINVIRPGTIYYDVHLNATDIALRGLLKLGILKGDEDEVREAGTVSAFFPHGLGHHVGLEVHDVTGDDRLLMASSMIEGGKREMVTPMSLHHMRTARAYRSTGVAAPPPYKGRQALQPNMIVTVEPGIYFCRPYIEGYFLSDKKHAKFIDKGVLEKYYDVGGVRIEDDILVTEDGFENLTTAPKGDELLDVMNGSFERI